MVDDLDQEEIGQQRENGEGVQEHQQRDEQGDPVQEENAIDANARGYSEEEMDMGPPPIKSGAYKRIEDDRYECYKKRDRGPQDGSAKRLKNDVSHKCCST
ncbi:MAG: hypothetical protein M3R08_07475 [Bacteroidota bacterium]|nr:hypothetical protein [Bacteroidota bacterium]